jgi:hypothetical protein
VHQILVRDLPPCPLGGSPYVPSLGPRSATGGLVCHGSGRELPSIVGALDGCCRRKLVIRDVVMAGSTESQSGRSECGTAGNNQLGAAAPSYCVASLSAGRVARARVRASELGLPRRGAEARNVALITEASRVQRILSHLGEPVESPPIAPALGGPCGTSDSVPFGTGMRWDNQSPSTCSTKRCTGKPRAPHCHQSSRQRCSLRRTRSALRTRPCLDVPRMAAFPRVQPRRSGMFCPIPPAARAGGKKGDGAATISNPYA